MNLKKSTTITMVVFMIVLVAILSTAQTRIVKTTYNITLLREETIVYYNETTTTLYSCWVDINQSWGNCYNTIITEKNYSIHKSVGYQVSFVKDNYTIIGDCCSFYNESPYKQFAGLPIVSCKQVLNNVCNPLIQQTSSDSSVFDEFGVVYLIYEFNVEPKRVGSYDYVNNYGINPSKLEVKR